MNGLRVRYTKYISGSGITHTMLGYHARILQEMAPPGIYLMGRRSKLEVLCVQGVGVMKFFIKLRSKLEHGSFILGDTN